MAVTNYVSPSGSNTSPYDTPAKAATNPNSALALWESGGGNKTYIAPGEYNYQITGPAYGASSPINEIIGDVTGEVFGVSTGSVVLYYDSGSVLNVSNGALSGCDFYNITINSLCRDPATGVYAVYDSASNMNTDTRFFDCALFGGFPYADTSSVVKLGSGVLYNNACWRFIRCRMMSSSFEVIAAWNQTDATPTTPTVQLYRCDIFSTLSRYGLVHILNIDAYKQYVDVYGCTILFPLRAATAGSGWDTIVFSYYADSSESKADIKRNCIYGYRDALDYQVSNGTRSDNYIFGYTAVTGTTRRTVLDHLPHFVNSATSSVLDSLSDGGLSGEYNYDFSGNDLTGDDKTSGNTDKQEVRNWLYTNSVGSNYPFVGLGQSALPVFVHHYQQMRIM
jgi:hypothetical protein